MQILKAHGLVLLATLLIAGSFLASANVTGQVHPVSLNLFRFVIATSCVLPVVLMNKNYRKQIPSVFPRSFLISFFYCGYFVCLFAALLTTTVLNTGTLYTLTPFVTAVFSLVLLKQPIGLSRIFAYILGAAGTLWVIFEGNIEAFQRLTLSAGDLIFMLGVFSMCGYTISMKLLYKQDSVAVLTCCTLIGGTLWMTLAVLMLGIPLQWNLLTTGEYASMIYLAIGTTLGTSYLYQKAATVLSPNNLTAYIYLSPAFVALLNWVVNGKTVSNTVMLGVVLSVIATLFLQLMSFRRVKQ